MNKNTIIIVLLALIAMTVQAETSLHVYGWRLARREQAEGSCGER